MPTETSKIVAAGMKRLSSDFNEQMIELGFKKIATRTWKKTNNETVENIHLSRRGSSYGSPINNSVDIRVQLSSKNTEDGDESATTIMSDAIRKSDGYAYHHRFNAKTWDSYDRCLEELVMFTKDYAESWFQKHRKANSRGFRDKIVRFFT